MAFEPGQVIHNRYRIVKSLSKGGFGRIYRAWDLSLKRPCAIKENLEVSTEGQEQFEREAQFLASLHHPHLARVTDYFSINGEAQCLVMDYVEGEDLQSLLARTGSIPEDQALTWVKQVCEALVYIHSQNPPIIHRDIKPANIRITPDGNAMLVDFGIAKRYEPSKRTVAGARAVTPGFSPIEQYGHGTTDPRTDLYALGATLYTLLTGNPPPESVQRMMGTPLPPPTIFNANVSVVVERATLKAMEVYPEQRFSNVLDFKSALNRSGVEATPPALKSQPPWLAVLMSILFLVSLVAVFAGILEASLINGILQGKAIARSTIQASDQIQNILSTSLIACLLIAGAGLVVWVYLTSRNLIAAGRSFGYSPAWAAGGFLIPLLNLVHPYNVMNAIWKVSTGESPAGSSAIEKRPLVLIWWLFCLLAGLAGLALLAETLILNNLTLLQLAWLRVIFYFLSTLAAGASFLLAILVGRRQAVQIPDPSLKARLVG